MICTMNLQEAEYTCYAERQQTLLYFPIRVPNCTSTQTKLYLPLFLSKKKKVIAKTKTKIKEINSWLLSSKDTSAGELRSL